MMNTTKGLGKSNQPSAYNAQKSEDEPAANKPITTTLLQELQNLKDKFKSEDDNVEKGMITHSYHILNSLLTFIQRIAL